MDREKFYCKRCGKELVDGGCLSQIDHELICIYCDNKEQPKELMKRITDLKLKLAECEQEKLLNSYGMDRNADIAEDYKQQLADLEAKLAESEKGNDEWVKICDGKLETINRLIEEKHELEETIKNKSHNKWLKAEAEKYKNEYQSLKSYIDQLKQQLEERFTEKDVEGLIKDREETIKFLKQQLAESKKKHLLDEKEWQDYCAFKHIEPQIKGCLDREREYEKQLAEKEKEIEWYKEVQRDWHKSDTVTQKIFNQTAIAELEKVKEWLNIPFDENGCLKNGEDLENYIDQQIKSLKGETNGNTN